MPLLLAAGASGDESTLTTSLVLILAAAGVVAMLARRLRLAVVPAYLITGAVIGPSALGLVQGDADVQEISHLAIVLLMFGIGLHFDLHALRGALGRMLAVAMGSIIGTILLLWPLILLTGISWPGGLVVAMALSLSSTAVVLRILQQRRQMSRMSGRLSLGILVVQDLAVIGMLLVIPPLALIAQDVTAVTPDDGGIVEDIGELVVGGAKGLGGVLGLILFGRFVLPRILQEAARAGTGEVLMVVSVAFAIGAGAITTILGLSAELGAFLGGFLLSATPFRHQLSGQIGTIRDLFIAVFFTVLGMQIDPDVLREFWLVILLITVALLSVKTLVIAGCCWASGTTLGVALKVGLSLAQGGEFGLLIMQEAQGPLFDSDTLGIFICVIGLSLMVTPPMISLADGIVMRFGLTRTAPWTRSERMLDADERHAQADGEATVRRHVIVAGYGVVGRAVCERLASKQASVTIVEMNPETVRNQRRLGRSMVYGDISDPHILESAGIDHATALVLTIPDEDGVLRACRTAKAINPSVFIIARTNFLSRAMMAHGLGANETVVEEMATAEAMDRLVLRVLGDDDDDEPLLPQHDPASA
ncbi:MAG: cation:proton antiporter [Planctomycetota bacterium]